MTERKTLKDLRRRDVVVGNGCPDESDYDIVVASEIKAEAIKRAKEEISKIKSVSQKEILSHLGRLQLLIEFFNITDGELEDGQN